MRFRVRRSLSLRPRQVIGDELELPVDHRKIFLDGTHHLAIKTLTRDIIEVFVENSVFNLAPEDIDERCDLQFKIVDLTVLGAISAVDLITRKSVLEYHRLRHAHIHLDMRIETVGKIPVCEFDIKELHHILIEHALFFRKTALNPHADEILEILKERLSRLIFRIKVIP